MASVEPHGAPADDRRVEVWVARADGDVAQPREWHDWLGEEERVHAARYARPADTANFVMRRAMLRQVLGQHLGRQPDTLAFATGPHGKPFLKGNSPKVGPFFNLSRSGLMAVLAVSDGCEVGIDVECTHPIGLEAAALFAAHEREELARLSGQEALLAFYRYWVCKEAVAKALGLGLSIPPRELEISPPGTPPSLQSLRGRPAPNVVLQVFHPTQDTMAALATFAPVRFVLRCWTPEHSLAG